MLRLFKRGLARNTRAGIALDGSRAGLARVRRLNDGSLSLAASIREAEAGPGEWTDWAASQADRMKLNQTSVSTVLEAGAYQLQLVEMPNVPAGELLAAVRWRLKDLIDYPVEEAVVELFEMPRHANPGSAAIAYAVVARRAEIMQQIDIMKRVDLRMDVIDIPELCVRNIAVLLPQDEDGVAFLHFTEDFGYLTITRKGILHMTRRLEVGRGALAPETDEFTLTERIAGIALEVQRSLDYYESHYDCRPVRDVVLGPGSYIDILPAALTEHLGLTVSRVSLDDLFSLEEELSVEQQGGSLLAVGAALRLDQSAQQVASS